MNSFGQKKTKCINLVISIDDNVVVGSVYCLQFIESDMNDNKKVFKADYIPGELSIKKADLKEIVSDKGKTIFLAFEYHEYIKEKLISHVYKIEIDKGWFQQSFIVLHIYNLDKEKYQKIFDPLEGCNYTYELDFSSNSMRRIRKYSSETK
jgi:hypothetical protein